MNATNLDYLSLMGDSSWVGDSPARFSVYKQGGVMTPFEGGTYNFFFVLEGELSMRDRYDVVRVIERGKVIVIGKQHIVELHCTPGSVILEFLPPWRINRFFVSTALAFSVPCSESIPLSEEIWQWIARLWDDCRQGVPIDRYYYCRELRFLLQACPELKLSTLAVPLKACGLHSEECANCK